MIGKSAVEKAKMNALREAGAAATEPEKAKIAELTAAIHEENRAYEQQQTRLAELNDAGREFAGTLASGLLDGAKASDVLADALGRLADRFINSGLDALFSGRGLGGILGGLLGGRGSSFPAPPGVGLFDKGGYTGSGGKYEPAGIVHRGEVVWSQNDVARAGGVGVVEAMRRGIRGYAMGGAVDMPTIQAPRLPDLRGMTTNNNSSTTNAPVINVTVNGATGNSEVASMVQVGVARGIQTWQQSDNFRISVGRVAQQAGRRGYFR
ncbi:hypothetical protein [Phyllobacterium salinisoli]|uniref:hypothetical protein n=1 Tax=Phyllobacterium salinisoli TaxID=1899321 RepID=UPI0011C017D6|nr:hypothetical protein [Phyllobacterium salinisoli]